MNIAILGNSLLAKVSAALFASVGNRIVMVSDGGGQETFNREPGLDQLYAEQRAAGRITTLNSENASQGPYDFIIVADVLPDELASDYPRALHKDTNHCSHIIILTPSRIGEADDMVQQLKRSGYSVSVNSIPLLVREGRALNDFSRPRSILIGCDDEKAQPHIKRLFYPFNRVKNVIQTVSTKEAEFSNFATCAMLATRLSFMNEMAELAEKSGVDIEVIRECLGRDPRIGLEYLYPGCGFGGKTLTENVETIANELRHRNDDAGLLDAVLEINRRQKDILFRKIWRCFDTRLEDKTVAIWGATFKPGSTSIEQAPAIQLIDSLLSQSTTVKVYDPCGLDAIKSRFGEQPNLLLANSAYDACKGADALAICTEWKEFWSPDYPRLKELMKTPYIFDGRNLYDPELLRQAGFKYFAIGRGESV